MKLENWELQQRQSLPLGAKVRMTTRRIIDFYEHFDGDVYVSFSGGKDSTVLLDIARKAIPDIEAVFCDTWLEYPEVRQHVKTFDNVTILKPKMSMKEIIERYGWNYPSKDVAKCIYYARKGSAWAINKLKGLDKDGKYSEFRQQYKKFEYLIDAPFDISDKCCLVMKEQPIIEYERETGKHPIMALMADESERRKRAYLMTGCNAFDTAKPNSKPMGFWTEQDVLRYIKENDLKIPSVYGKIKEKGQIDGQMTMFDYECELELTGEQRTGCVFCPVGCHLDNGAKYKRLKELQPKLYKYVMEELELGKFLDYIGVDYK